MPWCMYRILAWSCSGTPHPLQLVMFNGLEMVKDLAVHDRTKECLSNTTLTTRMEGPAKGTLPSAAATET